MSLTVLFQRRCCKCCRFKGILQYILSSEYGDLYTVTFTLTKGNAVTNVNLRYLDSIPPPLTMNVTKEGSLMTTSEGSGDTMLFSITSLVRGTCCMCQTLSSFKPMYPLQGDDRASSSNSVTGDGGEIAVPLFTVHGSHKNILSISEYRTHGQIRGATIANRVMEDSNQIYSIGKSIFSLFVTFFFTMDKYSSHSFNPTLLFRRKGQGE